MKSVFKLVAVLLFICSVNATDTKVSEFQKFIEIISLPIPQIQDYSFKFHTKDYVESNYGYVQGTMFTCLMSAKKEALEDCTKECSGTCFSLGEREIRTVMVGKTKHFGGGADFHYDYSCMASSVCIDSK